MSWFGKSKEELQHEQESKRWREEQEHRKREQLDKAESTVYKYADELKFPTRDLDVRFYNHLFSILLDQQNRIEELERQLKEKKDV